MKKVKIISIHSKDACVVKHERLDNVEYEVEVPEGTINFMLGKAFMLTNQDDRPMKNRLCSTSVGDIMVLDGRHYMVEPIGFREITVEESDKIQELSCRDTCMGYDWLKAQHLI